MNRIEKKLQMLQEKTKKRLLHILPQDFRIWNIAQN